MLSFCCCCRVRKWTGPGGTVQEPVLSRKKDKTMAATNKDATKEGTDLKSSGGETVTNRKQTSAIAIAISEAGRDKKPAAKRR